MKKLDLQVHDRLEHIFGYSGNKRFVVFFWEPFADKLMYEDGEESGTANSWTYLIWAGHPSVKPYLPKESGLLLTLDRERRELLMLDRSEATERLMVGQNPTLPFEEIGPQPFKAAQQALSEFILWLSQQKAEVLR